MAAAAVQAVSITNGTDWVRFKFGLDVLGDIPEDELWMDFLIEKGAGIQRKYGDYLRSIGLKAPVGGVNWWDLKFSAFEREEPLDLLRWR